MNVVIARTYNEAKHIERFCQKYRWADQILIADGGSFDGTSRIARAHNKVQVRYFHPREWKNGVSYNPEGKHINFLIDWAIEEGADWIIMDDCDSCPTQALQEDARELLQHTSEDVLGVYRLYVYGVDQWFTRLTGGDPLPPVTYDKDGKMVRWQGLWAWRAKLGLRWNEADPFVNELVDSERMADGTFTWRLLHPPYALLHYFCIDEQEVERKLELYRTLRETPQLKHPLKEYGPLAPLPDWAKP